MIKNTVVMMKSILVLMTVDVGGVSMKSDHCLCILCFLTLISSVSANLARWFVPTDCPISHCLL